MLLVVVVFVVVARCRSKVTDGILDHVGPRHLKNMSSKAWTDNPWSCQKKPINSLKNVRICGKNPPLFSPCSRPPWTRSARVVAAKSQYKWNKWFLAAPTFFVRWQQKRNYQQHQKQQQQQQQQKKQGEWSDHVMLPVTTMLLILLRWLLLSIWQVFGGETF